jgi:hypothetical protein
MNKICGFVIAVAIATSALAWPTVYPTGVTVHDPTKAESGYVLFCPLESAGEGGSGSVYLIDMKGNLVHQWSVPFAPLHGRLLRNGNIAIIGRHDKHAPDRIGVGKYETGGVAGWLVELDWDGELVFKHTDLAMHHDFVKLAYGNYVYLAWERVPPGLMSKVRGGIKGSEFDSGATMFNDKLVEIDPTGRVVWEWHANDHFDPDLDIIGPLYKRQEWYHGNSVWALSDGNLAMTGRHTDSLIVIDRATGKIKLRFGSTAYLDKETGRIEYRTGADTAMGGPHDVREIPAGFPGAGDLTCYDNGTYVSASRVVEIDAASGDVKWKSPKPTLGRKHYSDFVAGAQRLPRGNTLVTDGANGRIFQMTRDGEIVWEYVSPIVPSSKYQGAIFKAYFYTTDHCPQLQALPNN